MKWIISAAVIVVCCLCSCVKPPSRSPDGHRFGERFALSEQRRQDLIRESNDGNGKAAYLLALHYLYALGDVMTGEKWMARSRELGFKPKSSDVP